MNVERNRIFTTTSPWVVGREALLEEAVDDFLHETTRRQPWLRARFEGLLGELVAAIETELGQPAPVTALNRERGSRWLVALGAERALGERALETFADYLVKWRWTETHPLRPAYAV